MDDATEYRNRMAHSRRTQAGEPLTDYRPDVDYTRPMGPARRAGKRFSYLILLGCLLPNVLCVAFLPWSSALNWVAIGFISGLLFALAMQD